MNCLYVLTNGDRRGSKCMEYSNYRYCDKHLKIIGRIKCFFLTPEEKEYLNTLNILFVEDYTKCIICKKKKINVINYPCKHAIYCDDCFKNYCIMKNCNLFIERKILLF